MSKVYKATWEGKVSRFITVEANNEEEAKKAAAEEFSLLVGAYQVKILDIEESDDE